MKKKDEPYKVSCFGPEDNNNEIQEINNFIKINCNKNWKTISQSCAYLIEPPSGNKIYINMSSENDLSDKGDLVNTYNKYNNIEELLKSFNILKINENLYLISGTHEKAEDQFTENKVLLAKNSSSIYETGPSVDPKKIDEALKKTYILHTLRKIKTIFKLINYKDNKIFFSNGNNINTFPDKKTYNLKEAIKKYNLVDRINKIKDYDSFKIEQITKDINNVEKETQTEKIMLNGNDNQKTVISTLESFRENLNRLNELTGYNKKSFRNENYSCCSCCCCCCCKNSLNEKEMYLS